jgi:hypothetical protein
MSDAVLNLLNSFAQLSPAEQITFVKELRKKCQVDDTSIPEFEEMSYIADQMFQAYDREEAENASA